MKPTAFGFPCRHLIKVILHYSENTIEILDTFIHERWRKHDGMTVLVPDKTLDELLDQTGPTNPLQNIGAPTRLNRYVLDKAYSKQKLVKYHSHIATNPEHTMDNYTNALPSKEMMFTNRRRNKKAADKLADS